MMNKNIDLMRVDELVNFLQAYKITLSSSRKTKEIALNATKENIEFDFTQPKIFSVCYKI